MNRINPVILVMLAFVALQGCGVNHPSADEIISKAIERHGGGLYEQADIDFKFRGKTFKTKLVDGQYQIERMFSEQENAIMDVLKEDKTIARWINNQEISLDGSSRENIYNNTNSVVYFALLPYRLNDPAVNKQLMCTSDINGEPYYKVEITFDDPGGGKDFEDSFIYWIHKDSFTVDYLAYSYNINGGGVRFRKAYNQREVNGIRFQDYVNYTIDQDFPAHELDYAFQSGMLRELSRVDLEEVQVKIK